jgi:hypothetical protein
MAMVGLSVGAQTNLITFTNRNHEVISNAVVIKCDGVRLVYRTEGASGGSVPLMDLPQALQERFGYDPEKARLAQSEERLKQSKEYYYRSKAALDATTAKLNATLMRRAEESRTSIWARVIQRTPSGLLIDADSLRRDIRDGNARSDLEGNRWGSIQHYAEGTILLTDYPKEKSAADGDTFGVVGFPTGMHEYVTVNGSKKTVRRYTADINKAAALENFVDR